MRRRLRALVHHLKSEHTEPARLGWAVGLGVFVGVLPLYGLHTALCLLLAVVLRLNKATMVLASNVSIPLVAPFLVAAGIGLGEWLRFGEVRPLSLDSARTFLGALQLARGELPDLFLSCLLGDAVLGAVLGGLGGLGVWWWARRPRHPPKGRIAAMRA